MKTANIPSIRVESELRQAADSVLHNGESLSSFVVESIQANIKRRRMQKEFICRGLASRDEARRIGEYFDTEDVLRELDDMLSHAQGK
ncbi:MAG: prevent-host-death protein [Desulfobulbaceae bacterium]|nr:prevent-host-death protein [Desulfobulbaceae bacterium]